MSAKTWQVVSLYQKNSFKSRETREALEFSPYTQRVPGLVLGAKVIGGGKVLLATDKGDLSAGRTPTGPNRNAQHNLRQHTHRPVFQVD